LAIAINGTGIADRRGRATVRKNAGERQQGEETKRQFDLVSIHGLLSKKWKKIYTFRKIKTRICSCS
tara:strand:+ start:2251 stop:2451 length:201 start_codon:yes stop_codon:yes gene_type:complete